MSESKIWLPEKRVVNAEPTAGFIGGRQITYMSEPSVDLGPPDEAFPPTMMGRGVDADKLFECLANVITVQHAILRELVLQQQRMFCVEAEAIKAPAIPRAAEVELRTTLRKTLEHQLSALIESNVERIEGRAASAAD